MSAWKKTCPACGKRKGLKDFYRRSLGCKSSPGMPYGECKPCHHARTNENRRRLRVTSPRFRRAERAARIRYEKRQKRARAGSARSTRGRR